MKGERNDTSLVGCSAILTGMLVPNFLIMVHPPTMGLAVHADDIYLLADIM